MIESTRLRRGGHVARMEEGKSAFIILAGKLTGKRYLGSPRRRWEDIRMNLKEIRRIGLILFRIWIVESPCE